jgi:hypothetical protein
MNICLSSFNSPGAICEPIKAIKSGKRATLRYIIDEIRAPLNALFSDFADKTL